MRATGAFVGTSLGLFAVVDLVIAKVNTARLGGNVETIAFRDHPISRFRPPEINDIQRDSSMVMVEMAPLPAYPYVGRRVPDFHHRFSISKARNSSISC